MSTNDKSVLSEQEYNHDTWRCEYLVIGSGAGGSISGALLAEAKRDVIILEEGGYFPTDSYSSNISDMTAMLYRNRGVFPFLGIPTIAFAEGRCVGGGTVINGGLFWRTPPWILDQWVLKNGLTEFDPDSLVPHFEVIEKDLNVVIRPPESDANLDSMALRRGAESLGWKSVMIPHAVKGCTNLNLCPTGCLSGAKQSMLETYLPRAMKNGARVFSNCRALTIEHSGRQARSIVASVSNKKKIVVKFDHLILAAGAIQTPHLLRRSGLSRLAGRKLQFHLNLKIVARFREEISAKNGAMFTVQVQEFERDGLLIMGSNLQPHYVAMSLGNYGPKMINRLLESYDHLGIFVAMIRPKSWAHIASWTGDNPLIWYRFNPSDLEQIRLGLERACTVLFESGALELFLPIVRDGRVTSMTEVRALLSKLTPKELELISVHAMSSCPMGTDESYSVVDPDGKLRDLDNVTIADASILPTNIGESPQGTLMAFAHKVITNQLN
jgi:choline dehydrogenase-like flavoprotein